MAGEVSSSKMLNSPGVRVELCKAKAAPGTLEPEKGRARAHIKHHVCL